MSRKLKATLLGSTAAIAIASSPIAPALAFDAVNWSWDAQVTETVTKTVDVNINLVPTGMVMVEDLQVHIGDITATSDVTGIDNNQPTEGSNGGTGSGELELQFHYDNDGLVEDNFQSPEITSATVTETSTSEFDGTVELTVDLSQVELPPTQPSQTFDALIELPSINSEATAVANNTSIESAASIELHEGQFAFNVEGESNLNGNNNLLNGAETENSNLTAANVLGVFALTGEIEAIDVKARSSVSDILNATVDSSATAVVNNLTINLEPDVADNSLVIADIVQFSLADVTAKSEVTNVSLNNYTNLGSLESSIINSVATAVGNNKSITVAAPVIGGTVPGSGG
jgi:phage tail protein X